MSSHLKPQKILITGGAGAIGSYIANELSRNEGVLIDVIDNLDSGYLDNLRSSENIRFFLGSVTDSEFVKEFESGEYDYIFHLATCFANQNSIDHPNKDLDVNIKGTLNTLLLAQKQRFLKKYIYFSSSCIYGALNQAMRETDTPKPDTPYAISKLTGEYYTNFFHHYHKLPTNIFRLFNIYGGNERPGKYRNVIPNFVEKALRNEDITIMGDGTDTRDFTFIDDALERILSISFDTSTTGEIYNIGNGSPTKIIDLATAVRKATKSKSRITHLPKRDWDTVGHRLADMSKSSHIKIKRTPLKIGIKQVVRYVKSIRQNKNS